MMRVKPIKADIKFTEELEKIKLERIKRGIDKAMKSNRRLTMAIRRHPDFPRIKDDIIKDELREDLI